MPSSDDHPKPEIDELYARSYADLAQLSTRLPEDAVRALAREVIDRLARELRRPDPAPHDIEALARALVGPAPVAAAQMIEALFKAGSDAETLYLGHLAGAARLLGQWWESDDLSFAQVTTGTGRIYAIMRSLRPRLPRSQLMTRKSAFFATVPGDDHNLGARMATDLARKDGWEIELALDLAHDPLVEAIAASGQLLVGLSGAGVHSLPALARLILALRIATPNALILVSGNVVDVAGESVALMHADATAREFRDAMRAFEQLRTSLRAAPPA